MGYFKHLILQYLNIIFGKKDFISYRKVILPIRVYKKCCVECGHFEFCEKVWDDTAHTYYLAKVMCKETKCSNICTKRLLDETKQPLLSSSMIILT